MCFKVGYVELAVNGQFPYSEWTVNNSYIALNYANNLIQCSFGVANIDNDKLINYHDEDRVLYFEIANNKIINKTMIFDLLRRKTLEKNNVID